jgi:nitroimidazol reductase NimA-like FMN-containing flavoprotein (pyridoxamine 5'-phosphate oxidase superfamily)
MLGGTPTAGGTVPLSRLLTAAPRLAGGVVRTAGSRALDNARTAAATLGAVVAERRQLAPAEHDDSPGALSRLGREECLTLLASRSVGRLAYVARAGVPDIVPVNYRVHEGDVLIRSGAGPKLQAAERGDVVAFEVDDIDDDAHAGWSVVVVGRARRLSRSEQLALPADALPQAWANGPRLSVLRIRPTRLDGRRLT